MKMLSATDVLIARAIRRNALKVTEHNSRFNEPYWAISDEQGLIEVHNTHEEALARVNSLTLIPEGTCYMVDSQKVKF